MSVLSTTALFIFLYYLQSSWPRSNWLCATVIHWRESVQIYSNRNRRSEWYIFKQIVIWMFKEKVHKHELKRKEKKTKNEKK